MAGIDPRSKFLKTLLLALVLAVQVFGHAHAVDHSLSGDNTLCSICSIAGHGADAIVDSGGMDITIPTQQATPTRSDQSVPRTAEWHHDTRAPPLS